LLTVVATMPNGLRLLRRAFTSAAVTSRYYYNNTIEFLLDFNWLKNMQFSCCSKANFKHQCKSQLGYPRSVLRGISRLDEVLIVDISGWGARSWRFVTIAICWPASGNSWMHISQSRTPKTVIVFNNKIKIQYLTKITYLANTVISILCLQISKIVRYGLKKYNLPYRCIKVVLNKFKNSMEFFFSSNILVFLRKRHF